jgi:hypothetical protein
MSMPESRIAIVGAGKDVFLRLLLGAAVAVIGAVSIKATRAIVIFLFIGTILLNISGLSIAILALF